MAKIIADRRIQKSSIDKKDLERIKANIKDSYDSFKENYDRAWDYKNFVCRTSLSDSDISLMKELGRPQIEFPILEAYVSGQRGEFAKQEPTLQVGSSDDAMEDPDPQLVSFIEGYIRHNLFESNRDNMLYDTFSDTLIGGFSAWKVVTDYVNDMSFNQNIKLSKVFDPTLTFFDKFAMDSHKGDGAYCGELFPYSREVFEQKFGKEATDGMKFTRMQQDSNEMQGFNWSFSTSNKEIVLVAIYFEKKITKTKIYQLIDGRSIKESEYKKMVADWNESNIIMPPGIVGEPRETELVSICRYTLTETAILEYVETDYKYLPIIFVDGDSVRIRKTPGSVCQQLTRPMVYHAKGVQKLKNFAGIMLANYLENTVQHKIMAPKEGIPAEYKEAYINVQKPSNLIYNAFKDNDPNVPLPPPQMIPLVPCPPEITNTFMISDQVAQAVLGRYDAALGINNNELSGSAIDKAATQSSAASMPYRVNYIKALNRVAEIYVDLIPKYLTQPRKVHVRGIDGKVERVPINTSNGLKMDFDPNSLHVKVEAGVSFELQRQKAVQTIIMLMKSSPKFAEFMTQEKGLETLLDNIDIRGIDSIKQGVKEFCERMEQMQSQSMQMQQQNNPIMLKKQELDQKAQNNEVVNQIEAAKVGVSDKKADTERLLAIATIGEKTDKITLERDKTQAENVRTAVDLAISKASHGHNKAMDILKIHHANERHDREIDNRFKENPQYQEEYMKNIKNNEI